MYKDALGQILEVGDYIYYKPTNAPPIDIRGAFVIKLTDNSVKVSQEYNYMGIECKSTKSLAYDRIIKARQCSNLGKERYAVGDSVVWFEYRNGTPKYTTVVNTAKVPGYYDVRTVRLNKITNAPEITTRSFHSAALVRVKV